MNNPRNTKNGETVTTHFTSAWLNDNDDEIYLEMEPEIK